MSIKFTDNEGWEFEFRGITRKPSDGEYYLGSGGWIEQRHSDTAWVSGERAIVHLIPQLPITHDFGGIRFEETGEERLVEFGEWYLAYHSKTKEIPTLWTSSRRLTASSWPILKPIAIIDQEE